jgi:hypothetical protein
VLHDDLKARGKAMPLPDGCAETCHDRGEIVPGSAMQVNNQEGPPGPERSPARGRRSAQGSKRFAREAEDGPLLEQDGPKALVKLDGRLVPVEDGPLHAAAAALHGNPGHALEERPSDSVSAKPRPHEDVLEVKPRSSQERGIILEEDRKARRLVLVVSDEDLGAGLLAEEALPQEILRGHDLVAQALVLGNASNEGEDQRHVIFLRRDNVDEGMARGLSWIEAHGERMYPAAGGAGNGTPGNRGTTGALTITLLAPAKTFCCGPPAQ